MFTWVRKLFLLWGVEICNTEMPSLLRNSQSEVILTRESNDRIVLHFAMRSLFKKPLKKSILCVEIHEKYKKY